MTLARTVPGSLRPGAAVSLAALFLAGAASAAGVEHNLHTDGSDRPYSESVTAGGFLFLSGVVSVSDDPEENGIEAETTRSMDIIADVLERNGVGFSDVTRCVILLADIEDYPAFNPIYVSYFETGMRPARTTSAGPLPLDAAVEIECTAYLGGDAEE